MRRKLCVNLVKVHTVFLYDINHPMSVIMLVIKTVSTLKQKPNKPILSSCVDWGRG